MNIPPPWPLFLGKRFCILKRGKPLWVFFVYESIGSWRHAWAIRDPKQMDILCSMKSNKVHHDTDASVSLLDRMLDLEANRRHLFAFWILLSLLILGQARASILWNKKRRCANGLDGRYFGDSAVWPHAVAWAPLGLNVAKSPYAKQAPLDGLISLER